jgi:hypothetical protein
LGEGVLDLKSIVKKGQEIGVEHFLVEQDLVVAPEVALKNSFNYMKKLK